MKTLILGALAAAAVALPAATYAQMYAYVNQAGEVMTMDAANPDTAIATAPGIDEHSGVMVVSADDDVIGDNVQVK